MSRCDPQRSVSDVEAVEIAVKAEVSSVTHLRPTYGRTSNRGLGLSILSELVGQSLGYLMIISGNGWYLKDGVKPSRVGEPGGRGYYQGTLVSAAFPRNQIGDYLGMHNAALEALGLQTRIPSAIRFL